eukprot:scaffold620_cov169-Amphora_coffeaeformis.AAC.9
MMKSTSPAVVELLKRLDNKNKKTNEESKADPPAPPTNSGSAAATTTTISTTTVANAMAKKSASGGPNKATNPKKRALKNTATTTKVTKLKTKTKKQKTASSSVGGKDKTNPPSATKGASKGRKTNKVDGSRTPAVAAGPKAVPKKQATRADVTMTKTGSKPTDKAAPKKQAPRSDVATKKTRSKLTDKAVPKKQAPRTDITQVAAKKTGSNLAAAGPTHKAAPKNQATSNTVMVNKANPGKATAGETTLITNAATEPKTASEPESFTSELKKKTSPNKVTSNNIKAKANANATGKPETKSTLKKSNTEKAVSKSTKATSDKLEKGASPKNKATNDKEVLNSAKATSKPEKEANPKKATTVKVALETTTNSPNVTTTKPVEKVTEKAALETTTNSPNVTTTEPVKNETPEINFTKTGHSCEDSSLSTMRNDLLISLSAPRWLQEEEMKILNDTPNALNARKLMSDLLVRNQAVQDIKKDVPTLTTTALYLAGTLFQEDEVDGMDHYAPTTFPECKLSLYQVSCRSAPASLPGIFQAVQVAKVPPNDTSDGQPQLVVICDTFSLCCGDTTTLLGGLEERLAATLCFRQSFRQGTFKPVLVFHVPTMRANKYQELRDTLQSIHGMVPNLKCLEYVFTGCPREKDKYRIHKELAAFLRDWTQKEACWIPILSDMIAKTTPVAHVIDPMEPDRASGMLAQLLSGYNKPEQDDGNHNSAFVSSLQEGNGTFLGGATVLEKDMQQAKLHVDRLLIRYSRAHKGRLYALARRTIGELEYLATVFPFAAAALDKLTSPSSIHCLPALEELAEAQALIVIEQAIKMTREGKQQGQSGGNDEDGGGGTLVEGLSFDRENLTANSTFQGELFDFVIRKATKEEFEKNSRNIMTTTAEEDRRRKLLGILDRHVNLVDALEPWYRVDREHKSTIQRAQEQLVQGAKVIVQEDLAFVEKELCDPVSMNDSSMREVGDAMVFLFRIQQKVRSGFPIPPADKEEVYSDSWAWIDAVPKRVMMQLIDTTQSKTKKMESQMEFMVHEDNDTKDDCLESAFTLFCLWRDMVPFVKEYDVCELLRRFERAGIALVTESMDFLDQAAQLIPNASPETTYTEENIDDLLDGARWLGRLFRTFHEIDSTMFSDQLTKLESIEPVLMECKKKREDTPQQPKETQNTSTSNDKRNSNKENAGTTVKRRKSNPGAIEKPSANLGKQCASSPNKKKKRKVSNESKDVETTEKNSSSVNSAAGRPKKRRKEITDTDPVQSEFDVQEYEKEKAESGDGASSRAGNPSCPLRELNKGERDQILSIEGGVRWMDRYEEYLSFRKENDGSYSSQQEHEMIRAMDWFEIERSKWKRGDLSDACKVALVKAGLKLSDDEMTPIGTAEWKRLFNEVNNHKKRRNAFPRNSSGAIGKWLYIQIYFLEVWRATGEYPGHDYHLAEERYKAMKKIGVKILESLCPEAGTPDGDKKRKARPSTSEERDANREQSAGERKPAVDRSIASAPTDVTASVQPQQKKKKRRRATLTFLKPLDTVRER